MNTPRLRETLLAWRAALLSVSLVWGAAGAQSPGPAQDHPEPAPPSAAAATPPADKAARDSRKEDTAARGQSKSAAKRPDRLELEKTVVTGNRELPKVLYIVPWKKANLGDLPGQPFNSLLDEALTPVDRDVFRRELHYYDALESASGQVEK